MPENHEDEVRRLRAPRILAWGLALLVVLGIGVSLYLYAKSARESAPMVVAPAVPSPSGSERPPGRRGAADELYSLKEHRDAGRIGGLGRLGGPRPLEAPKVSQSVAEAIAQVDTLLRNLPLGNIVFNVPKSLGVGESTAIVLRLSMHESIEELKKSLTAAAGEQRGAAAGEQRGAQIRVADRIEARLTGSAFKIQTITPEVQAIGTETTEWQWQIEPTTAGRQTLHLTLSALLDISGERVPRAIRTFDETIEIQVSWSKTVAGFFKENWKWLWTTLLVPLAGWLWAKRVRDRKRARRR